MAFIVADEKVKQFHNMMLKNGVSEHVTIYTLSITAYACFSSLRGVDVCVFLHCVTEAATLTLTSLSDDSFKGSSCCVCVCVCACTCVRDRAALHVCGTVQPPVLFRAPWGDTVSQSAERQ